MQASIRIKPTPHLPNKQSVATFEIPYKGYWSKKANQRVFFDWLGTQLKLQSLDDWRNVTVDDVIQHGGRTVLKNYYENSLFKALTTLYPEHDWKIWPHIRIHRDFFSLIENQRKIFDTIVMDLKLSSPTDLAHLSLSTLERTSKRVHYIIAKYYSLSVEKALRNIYPEVDWSKYQFHSDKPQRKTQYSRTYWSDLANQKAFLDNIKSELNIQTEEDWTQVGYRDIMSRGGRTLMELYDYNVAKLVDTVYASSIPRWMFKRVTRDYWQDIKNQREYFDWLAKELNISNYEGWYNVKLSELKTKYKCAFVFEYYSNSLSKALEAIYPEYSWQPWRFTSTPKRFWSNESNLRKYMDWLGEQLGITTLDDWYNIPVTQVTAIAHVFGQYGGFIPMLAKLYPHHNWNFSGLAKQLQQQGGFGVIGKSQAHLVKIVGAILPNEPLEINYKHEHMHFENTNRPVELDVFLPNLRLALEYQGEQHYGHHYLFGDSSEVQQRDKEKKAACDAEGITLIPVPYWWDRTKASLQATLHKYRPDLVSSSVGKPIPENPPPSARPPRKINIKFSQYPYYISLGLTNNQSKCRGCDSWIRGKNTLRVVAHGSFTPFGKSPMPTKFMACLHPEEDNPLRCLKKAGERYEKGTEGSGIHFPTFQNVIGVTESAKSVLPLGFIESLMRQGVEVPEMKE